jgi:hypothetical protein
MKQDKILICDSYLSLTAACSQYQDNWICDETCIRLLNAHYPRLKNTFNFTREGLNGALSAKAGPFTGPNEFGLFSVKFRTECPYSGERRRVWYFYRQVNGKPLADPVSPLHITDELSKSNSLQRDCMQLGRGGGDPPLDGNTPERWGGGDPPSDGNSLERGGGNPPLDGNTPERTHSNQHNDLGEVITPCRDQPDAGLDNLPIYWESPEAAKLFGFDYKNGDGDDVFDGLTVRRKTVFCVFVYLCIGAKKSQP